MKVPCCFVCQIQYAKRLYINMYKQKLNEVGRVLFEAFYENLLFNKTQGEYITAKRNFTILLSIPLNIFRKI